MRSVRLDPEAETELQEAAAFYSARSKPVSRRFLRSVMELSQVIRRSLERFPRLSALNTQLTIRRALVPGFPYAVVFVPIEDRIQVLAVCHMRREPGYWLHRLVDE